jgi:hypothetical protein
MREILTIPTWHRCWYYDGLLAWLYTGILTGLKSRIVSRLCDRERSCFQGWDNDLVDMKAD